MSFSNIFPDGTFKPSFQWVDSLYEAAEEINKPHEDYPNRVEITHYVLNALVSEKVSITANMALQIHSMIMWDLHESCRGKYRPMPVTVAGHEAPPPWQVPFMIEECGLFPFDLGDDIDIRNWYRVFEEIHPFADGNGRVGGVILSAHSYVAFDRILAPAQ